jgi:hypothetical protein
MYTHVVQPPADPVVAAAMQGQPWDEALGGAAAGVALALVEGASSDPYSLRWKAVLAGYPYPVVQFGAAWVAHGEHAPELSAEARAKASGGADVGLVRARGRDQDVWVLLVGGRRSELPRFPREAKVGERVEFASPVVYADPEGGVHTDRVVALDRAGEWLVQVQDRQGSVATVPVYVGMSTPGEPPIQDDARGDTQEAAARDLIHALAGWYGRAAPTFDSGLDSVARARLNVLEAGGAPEAADRQLQSAGWVGMPVAGGECRGSSVAACLDGMWWSPDRRGVLVADYTAYGVAAGRVGDDVVLTVVAAKEPG